MRNLETAQACVVVSAWRNKLWGLPEDANKRVAWIAKLAKGLVSRISFIDGRRRSPT